MAVNSLRSRGRPAWPTHTCSVAKGLPHRETDDQARCAAEGERWYREAEESGNLDALALLALLLTLLITLLIPLLLPVAVASVGPLI